MKTSDITCACVKCGSAPKSFPALLRSDNLLVDITHNINVSDYLLKNTNDSLYATLEFLVADAPNLVPLQSAITAVTPKVLQWHQNECLQKLSANQST